MNRGRRTVAFDQVPSDKTDRCSGNTYNQTMVFKLCTVEPWRHSRVPRAYFLHNTNSKYNFDNFNCFCFIFATRECIFTILGLRKNPYFFARFPQTLRDWRRLAPYYTRETLDLNRGYTFSWLFPVSSRKIPGRYRN